MTDQPHFGPPELHTLSKFPVQLDRPPSSGAVQGCRLAVQDGDTGGRVLFASSNHIYTAALPAEASQSVQRGKEGVYIPHTGQAVVPERLQVAHQAEIQSLAYATRNGPDGAAVLGLVDAYGHVVVAAFSGQPHEPAQPIQTYDLQPRHHTRESGWAGIALVPSGEGLTVAAARQFPRDICLYSNDSLIRTLYTRHHPAALAFLEPNPSAGSADSAGSGRSHPSVLLAVAEGGEVSLWDARAGEAGGCTQRVRTGLNDELLYALATTHTQQGSAFLGFAGAGRSIYVMDPRTWKMLDIWSCCLKYEVLSLSFSVADPCYVFAAGLDSEVLCGRWDSEARQGGGMRTGQGPAHFPAPSTTIKGQSFRGDSRWLSVARAPNSDLLAGLSASSHMFVASFKPGLSQPGQSADGHYANMTPHRLRHKQAASSAAEKLGHLSVAA